MIHRDECTYLPTTTTTTYPPKSGVSLALPFLASSDIHNIMLLLFGSPAISLRPDDELDRRLLAASGEGRADQHVDSKASNCKCGRCSKPPNLKDPTTCRGESKGSVPGLSPGASPRGSPRLESPA